jgi:hypothetical protein
MDITIKDFEDIRMKIASLHAGWLGWLHT